MAEDEKVFDVAKPGTAKPEMGAKPMVIGHKYITSDPTLKPESERSVIDDTKAQEPLPDETVQDAKKVVLKPLSEQEATPTTTSTTEPERTEVAKVEESAKETQGEETQPETDEASEKVDKQDDAEVQLEREERLQSMVRSKEYNVTIVDASASAARTFILVFLAVLLIGLIAIALLIDAEVIDAGISLPFNVIK